MKNYLKPIFLALIFFLAICCQSDKQEVTVKVFIDEKLTDVSQWVYWCAYFENNEVEFWDSIYLKEGQTNFQFRKKLPDENCEFKGILLFTKNKKGPKKVDLFLETGDKIEVYIDEKTKGVYPRTKGTLFNTEWFKFWSKRDSLADEIEKLNDLIVLTNSIDTIRNYEAQIDAIKDYYSRDFYLDALREVKSPRFATMILWLVRHKHMARIKEDTVDSIIQSLKKKHPSYYKIQLLPDEPELAPKTPESRKVKELMFNLIGIYKKDNRRREALKDSLKAVKPYQVGDIVKDVYLKGLDDKEVKLKDFKTDYVLIDFWASWCIPCRKETPYLRNAVEAYPEKLSVFAISFCNSEEEWKETIGKDNSGMFIHGYSGNFNSSETSIIFKAQFGIRAIPANFLLDKDRRIIATDLRGNDLINKMKELSEK